MTTLLITYSVWKQALAYLSLNGHGSVYYTHAGSSYTAYLVNVQLGITFSSTPVGPDLTDFTTNIKPTATLITASNDSVAMAIIAWGA